MARQQQSPEMGEREAAAAYGAEPTRDLAFIARRHGLDALGYILDMARVEAQSNAHPVDAQR